MRKLFVVAGLVAAALLVVGAGVARADDARTLDLRRPTWLTDELQAKIVAAGPQGLEIPLPDAGPDATVNPDCLGIAPAYASPSGVSVTAVSAGTCMVSPAGCTMNFVFSDGTSYYIGMRATAPATARPSSPRSGRASTRPTRSWSRSPRSGRP